MSTIRERAAACVSLFVQCNQELMKMPSTHGRHQLDIVEDQHGRFRVWCGNLGALQSGHASLDWRLREADNIRSRISGVLADVDDDLRNCDIDFSLSARQWLTSARPCGPVGRAPAF